MSPSQRRISLDLPWLLAAVPLLGFLFIPLAVLLLRGTASEALQQLGSREAQNALMVTCVATAGSLVLIAVFGTPVAFWLALRRSPLRRAIAITLQLPVCLPPAAAGIALLLAFGRGGVLHLSVSFTIFAVVLAGVFVASPLYLQTAINAFVDTTGELYNSALVDGANSWQVFRLVALPLARRSLVSGLALAWARCAGEFGATIIFAGNYPGRTQTVPLAIYLGFETNLDLALALALLLMCVSMIVLVVIALCGGRVVAIDSYS